MARKIVAKISNNGSCEEIFTQEYIQKLRDADKKHPDKLKIVAQKGGQEDMLAIDADIKICGGSRGGPLECNTLIETLQGDKPISQIKEGDEVCGIWGEPCLVIKSTNYGMLDCFKISTDNGQDAVCSWDHIWYVLVMKKDEELKMGCFLACDIFNFIQKGYEVLIPMRDLSLSKIASIEHYGKHECICLALEKGSDLYRLANGMVTHNSKSFSSLMEALYDIKNPDFHALILRKEKNDLQSIVSDSYKLYSQFGTFNKSLNDYTWNFFNGGWLKFSYYEGAYQDFKDRFQGRQYSYICIDEGTQCPYKKFKYLLTNNRNASGIRNRFWITCNPDPESWVREVIDWWVGDDGLIIPERNGVIRYCFMDGDTPNSIYWGDSREEVYEQCKHIIDPLWKEEYASLGYNKLDMFIKSITFIRADVSENVKLIATDPSYLANLAQQDEEQRMRDLEANWNWKAIGDDLVKIQDLEEIFNNAVQEHDNIHRASADIAFTGGDNFVMWHWVGLHTVDLRVFRLNSKTLISVVKATLEEWGVAEDNFTYDMQGIGQYFRGFFPNAVPFNNQAAPIATSRSQEEGIKYLYKDLKSQCAFMFYQYIKDKKISIDSNLLDRKFSGKGFEKVPLRQILQKERKCLRRDEESSDRSFKLLPKALAKKYVGHSPDFWESWMFIMIFFIKKNKNKKIKGLWRI